MIYSIVLALVAILAVIAYNIYQESQYRKQVREQFGHSDKGTLLGSKISNVHGGRQASGGKGLMSRKAAKPQQNAAMRNLQEQDVLFAARVAQAAATKPEVEIAVEDDLTDEPVKHTTIGPNNEMTMQAEDIFTAVSAPDAGRTLVSLDELVQIELPWFDPRFDYLAYIALIEAQGLHTLPRLSDRHRFQIIGCTMNGRFQVAEPIPSVYYQGFIMGLQAISRNGLASREKLELFNQQVNTFVQLMGGEIMHTDVTAFTEVAQALDEFCTRVDQTIVIHLVSCSSISGTELCSAVESVGFRLSEDGQFHFPGNNNDTVFSLSTLDNSLFTPSLLSHQSYRGFSMLFDISHIPAGEKTFDHFMDLTVKLSGQLSLDLVNDKMEELSTQWLKDVRSYVLACQEEMQKVDIESGSHQAQRLFF